MHGVFALEKQVLLTRRNHEIDLVAILGSIVAELPVLDPHRLDDVSFENELTGGFGEFPAQPAALNIFEADFASAKFDPDS